MNPKVWNQLATRFRAFQLGWQTWAIIAFDLGLMLASWKLWNSRNFAAGMAAILLLSLALLHFYLILHEATHSAVSRNSKINNWVGNLAGWAILMPFYSRKRSHLLHHMWTGHPTGDPANLRIIKRFSVMTPKQAAQ
ncbi:MAG: fatty acid desaturase, partial [Bdellovibrionota bacterium]